MYSMKKLRLLLATMMAILATASGWAQDDVEFYNLWINGTQVTSQNRTHLEDIEGVSGTWVVYTPSTKTLTLSNATIELATKPSQHPSLIESQIDGLKIVLQGQNVLRHTANDNNCVIQNTGNLTIISSVHGELLVEKTANLGSLIYVGGSNLTIKDCKVTMRSSRSNDWIFGLNIGNGSLTLDGASLDIANVYRPIYGASAVNLLNGTQLSSPTNAEWNSAEKCYYAGGNELLYDLSFIDTYYDVKIGGTQLTTENYQNISKAGDFYGINGGTVTFDPETNTLTLNNVRLDEAMSDVGLELTGPVNVVVEDYNEIPNETGILVNGNCTFSGNGTLWLHSTNEDGTALSIGSNCTLTIRDCTVDAYAWASYPSQGMGSYEEYAYAITGQTSSKLQVINAIIKAEIKHEGENGFGWWHSPICGVALSMLNSQFVSPEGAYYDSDYRAVYVGEGTSKVMVTAPVEISYPAEAYAVLDDQGTLTFYYDKEKRRREGTVYSVKKDATEYQAWGNNTSITTVDFDESFAEYDGMLSLYGFFWGLTNLTEIKHLDRLVTTNACNMEAMFNSCSSLTELDLSGFNTASVNNMMWMFYECSKLKTIYVGDGWNTDEVQTTSTNMFLRCTSLVGSQGTAYDADHITADYARIDRGQEAPGYLSRVREAYAVVDYIDQYPSDNTMILSESHKLTFYYDDQKSVWSQKELIATDNGDQVITRYKIYDIKSLAGNNTFNSVEFDDSFANYNGLTDLSNFFKNCVMMSSVEGLKNLNTKNVTSMEGMFAGCTKLTYLDLHHFNTENVTNMNEMFSGCSNLYMIRCNDDWHRNGVTGESMFSGCTKLKNFNENNTGIGMANPTTGYFTADDAYAVLDGQTLTFYYDNLKDWQKFQQKTTFDLTTTDGVYDWSSNEAIVEVDFDESFADYNGLTNTSKLFFNLPNLKTIHHLDRMNTENVTDMTGMFEGCTALEHVDLSVLNTEKVQNMFEMFKGCTRLTTVIASGINTSNVSNMMNMFYGCTNLATIYCTDDWQINAGWFFSTDMFSGCTKLVGGNGTKYDASHVDASYAHLDAEGNPGYFTLAKPYAVLSSVTLTFYYDNKKEARQAEPSNNYYYDLDGHKWTELKYSDNSPITKVVFDDSFADYHGLTNMLEFFRGLNNLTTIEGMRNLNTENVDNMGFVFYQCKKLTSVDLSHFDTEKVQTMTYMFSDCKELVTLDVSGFNTANVTDMEGMFAQSTALTTIYCNTDWALVAQNNGKQLNSNNMFYGCTSLKGGMGAEYNATDPQCQTAKNAHPDNLTSRGFFTSTVEKGNMNFDEVLDMDDVLALKDLILSNADLSEDVIARGDMNCDGELTIADVTLLINQVKTEGLQRELKAYLKSIKNDAALLKVNLEATFSLQGLPTSEAGQQANDKWLQLQQNISDVEAYISQVSTEEQKMTAQDKLAVLKLEVARLQEQIISLQYEPTADKEYLGNKRVACCGKLEELDELRKDLANKYGTNNASITLLECESAISEVRSQLSTLQNDIATINGKDAAQSCNVILSAIETRLATIEARLIEFKNQYGF